MNEIDYLKELPQETIKKILFKTPASDIISLCITDSYIQYICNDDIFWKEYVIKNNNLYTSVVTMWKNLIEDSTNFTWKRLAQLYELEQISKYKLNFWEMLSWDDMINIREITWDQLKSLYKLGKGIIVVIDMTNYFISIRPEMLLIDVIKEIISIPHNKTNVSFEIFELILYHPFRLHDIQYIQYDKSNNKLNTYDPNANLSFPYDDMPLEMMLFNILEQITVN